MRNYKFSILFLSFLFVIFSCTTGLGEVVDLEAPELSVLSMTSGDASKTAFETTIYTKQKVSFTGSASDNVKVSRVYAEVKWLGDSDYKYFAEANFKDNKWEIAFDFEKEGACWLKFVAEDGRKNYGVKSSKIITLFVDEKAPVGDAWYIDRMVNGIQYKLQSLESLKAIVKNDPQLSQPSNIDVAQNGTFQICSSFNDASGIASTSISIYNEAGQKVCGPINKIADSGTYAPKFQISSGLAASGPHYYQVRYSASDIVTDPAPNTVVDEEIEMGWFLWWPEMDNPRCSVSNLDEVGTLKLFVGDSINITVFDDDELNGTITCELKGEETVTKSVTAKEGERESNIIITTPQNPQTMTLTVTAKDKYSKSLSKSYTVYVSSDSKPTLIITTPENNQIPTVSGASANINFSGIVLDKTGCTSLDFVWVPDSVTIDSENKYARAKSWLDSIQNNHSSYEPASSSAVKLTNGTSSFENIKLWSAKLTAQADDGSGFKQQSFNFNIALLDDAGLGKDKNKDKYFYIRLSRKDGNYIDSQLKIAADSVKPEIIPITPGGNAAIVDEDSPLTIKFKAAKDNGLSINPAKYKITYISPEGVETVLPGTMENDVYKISTPITNAQLRTFKNNRENPKYKFYAEDVLGNSSEGIYQFVVSGLPSISKITSSSPLKCKSGDTVLINVSFTKSVTCNKNTKLKLKNIINTEKGITKDSIVYADIVESSIGSTTLVFKYQVQPGDSSDCLQVYNESGIGPIAGIDETSVHLKTLASGENLQDKRTIKIDANLPYVKNISVSSNANGENVIDGVSYLRTGKTISAAVTVSKPVSVQGTPTFILQNSNGSIALNFESISDDKKIINFSSKVQDSFANGNLQYVNSSYINGSEKIQDEYGNPLKIALSGTTTDAKLYVDTLIPTTPFIGGTDNANNDAYGALKTGKYKDSVGFKIEVNTDKTEYSKDGGSTWFTYSAPVTLTDNATLVARRTDKAGNVSAYSNPIYIEVNSTFPTYTLECTKADGNYKEGTELEFKVYFTSPVSVANDSSASIILSANNTGDIITSNAKAELDPSLKGKTNLSELRFTYVTKNTDQFSLKVKKEDVKLTGVSDLYGIIQGNKNLTADYSRTKLICDGIAPSITAMTPDGFIIEYDNKNVYNNGKVINLTFNEPVKVRSGKIYLRQTEGWAIPPMFTAKEFTAVLNAVKAATIDTSKTNGLTGSQVLYLDGLEDSEWLFGSNIGVANDWYHGTGQYAGPYKKTTQGISENGTPDITTKYVLDYDVDIWSSSESKKTKFGRTYAAGNESQTNTTSYYDNGKTNVKVVEPTNVITTDSIRYVLEQANYHQRIIDVTSSAVEISADGKTVTLSFPASLTGETDLPLGREWELIVEKGAFMDATGNIFAQDSTDTAIKVQNNGKDSFLSEGIAKPVIRVDRYSYGLGTFQPSESDSNIITSMINVTSTTNCTVPTAKVRVRIDCETKGATIQYGRSTASANIASNTDSNIKGTFVDTDLYKGDNKCTSYWTQTTVTAPNTNTGSGNQRVFILAGNGDYKKSSKEYITAKAIYAFTPAESAIEREGIFQTVLDLDNPICNNGTSISGMGAGKSDVSIRGTTGFAGEPYISPFPLRDSPVGSPYMKRAYLDSNHYYWVSYEILVKSSISIYSYNNNWRKCYNWGMSWGVIQPGEYTRCIYMRNWEN